mgnify:CR=1 FL=1
MNTSNTAQVLFSIVLVCNCLWFGATFWYFSFKSTSATKILTPRSERENTLFSTVAWSVKFLGGMNVAFSLFSALVLLSQSLFPEPKQHFIFALVFAVAHGSQFAFNVPLAQLERKGRILFWNVLSGPMLGIFIIDATLMIANLVAALLFLL